MTLATTALEWLIILVVFGIIYSKFAQRYPILKEVFSFMKKDKLKSEYSNPMEVKKQIWPENRAMI